MNSMRYYSIKDKHCNLFYPPFPARNDDEAKQIVSDSVEVGSIIAKFPADYILCHVGTFEFYSGFDVSVSVGFVCSMNDIIRPEIIERTRVLGKLVDKEVEVSE